MNNLLVLQENDLELVVSEKTLGSLTTNAMQIRNMVKAALPTYDISNYNDENIEQAKKDKASLNKASKALNAKRLEIEKEFMKPFGEFKEVVTETVKLISECSSKIDIVVKQNEQQYKDKKKKELEHYFDENNINHIDFRKIFKEAWLNKTISLKSAFSDMNTLLYAINDDIEAINNMEDADVLVTYYKDTLNLSSTVQYGNRLKEQRDIAKKAKEEKKEAEEKLKAASEVKPIQQDAIQQPIQTTIVNSDVADNRLLVRAFKVSTSRENIIALGNFMNERGISFEKIEIN